MVSKSDQKKFNVILVADKLDHKKHMFDVTSNFAEKISHKYFDSIKQEILSNGHEFIHLEHPVQISEIPKTTEGQVVFSIWAGTKSRNRRVFAPAIAEANGFSFVGPDAYALSLCQDKYTALKFAESFGFRVPQSRLIRREIDLNLLYTMNFPMVVKPNFEGGSMGIDESSLVFDLENAHRKCIQLLEIFGDSVVCEEFVSGQEVCICIAKRRECLLFFEAVEIYATNDPTFLSNNLYSIDMKKNSSMSVSRRSVTQLIDNETKTKCLNLTDALGKLDYFRIDGRLSPNGFVVTELTPDVGLGEHASFAAAAKQAGLSYTDLIGTLINWNLPTLPDTANNLDTQH